MGNYFEKACEVFYSTDEALGPGIEIGQTQSFLFLFENGSWLFANKNALHNLSFSLFVY